MKVSALFVAAAAALTATTAAQANLLLAPGFESPPAPDASVADQAMSGPIAASVPITQNPWFYGKSNTAATGSTAFYSSDIPAFAGTPAANRLNSTPSGATPPAFLAKDGHQYGYGYTVGQASGQVTYIAQGVTGASIIPGNTYSASAYFFNKNVTGGAADGDRLQASGSFDSLQLVFLDTTGAVISSAQSPVHVDSTTPANTWTQISFTAVAPAGTTSIVFENLLTRGATGGVMFVDAAALNDVTNTPEPASLGLASVGALALLRRRRA